MKKVRREPFQTAKYDRPRKNVLVISCIDLRLTDNLLKFLNAENLANRYDHISLAGAALCAEGGQNEGRYKYTEEFKDKDAEPWKEFILRHVDLAVTLHQVTDVYIVEHEDCGAYENFLQQKDTDQFKDDNACHLHFAKKLAKQIEAKKYIYLNYKEVDQIPTGVAPKHADDNNPRPVLYKQKKLNVHIFIMDVKGDVFYLYQHS